MTTRTHPTCRYTLDKEAAPEEQDAWTLYTEPIVLTEDCTVRFFARRSGFLDSPIVTYEFKAETSAVHTDGTEGIAVRKEAGVAVVYSDKAMDIPVYSLDGQLVRIVGVKQGRNVIDGLDSGIYIIGNVRIRL